MTSGGDDKRFIRVISFFIGVFRADPQFLKLSVNSVSPW